MSPLFTATPFNTQTDSYLNFLKPEVPYFRFILMHINFAVETNSQLSSSLQVQLMYPSNRAIHLHGPPHVLLTPMTRIAWKARAKCTLFKVKITYHNSEFVKYRVIQKDGRDLKPL